METRVLTCVELTAYGECCDICHGELDLSEFEWNGYTVRVCCEVEANLQNE